MRLRNIIAGVSVTLAAGGLGYGAGEALFKNNEAAVAAGAISAVVGGVAVSQEIAERNRKMELDNHLQQMGQTYEEGDVVIEAEAIVKEALFNANVERLEAAIRKTHEILNGDA